MTDGACSHWFSIVNGLYSTESVGTTNRKQPSSPVDRDLLILLYRN